MRSLNEQFLTTLQDFGQRIGVKERFVLRLVRTGVIPPSRKTGAV